MAEHLVAQEREPRRADAMQGAELAVGSHHSLASRAKRSISSGSSVAGSVCLECLQSWRIGALQRRPCQGARRRELLQGAGLVAKSTRVKPLKLGFVAGCRGPWRSPRHGPRHPGALTRVVMSFLVMKFGGTSVANVERIRNVARHVKREVDAGNSVAVVVSAMAGVTNQLVAWVREASPLHDAREYDAIVATGEQVTAGLLAIVLQSMGIQARSWQGWQIPIITDNAHGVARIKDIPGDKIRARLEQGEVAVITGFQGIEPERNRISTLGRGGSDTSAVAIAVAVKADLCDIYTDVDGVYTTDPRIVPRARRLPKVSYEEMLEMASLGSKVLQTRSVELAMLHRMRAARAFELRRAAGPEARAAGNLGRDRHHHLQRG